MSKLLRFEDHKYPDHVFKLKKALYGLTIKENQGSRSSNFLNWFVMIAGIYLFFFFKKFILY